MSLFLSPYQLKTVSQGQVRKGYLLKLSTDQFSQGFADIFPWPEFGDPNWEAIPKILKSHLLNSSPLPPLLSRSVAMATSDGLARAKKTSLLSGKRVRNHFLVPDSSPGSLSLVSRALEEGFDRLKLKVGRNFSQELSFIEKISGEWPDAIWRLDCNGLGEQVDWQALSSFKKVIEFIEDPYPEPQRWFGDWPWAYDQPPFSRDQVQVNWQVMKPAKQEPKNIQAKKVVFTSYLDHPVGQAHALLVASAQATDKVTCGLMSQHIYQPTAYHQDLCVEGAELSVRAGLGIGFDKHFEKENWEPLS